MGVQLNIKNARARALADELSEATGETVTQAVTKALEERLQRLRRLSDEEFVAKWLAIGKENRRRLGDRIMTQEEIDDWLYDEDGLPR